MSKSNAESELQNSRSPPLSLPLVPGMPIVVSDDGVQGTITGITQAYCIYRLDHLSRMSVAPWSEIALANICPGRSMLPTDVTAVDRANSSASVLRELLMLRQFGLTALQAATLDELVADLCRQSEADA